MNNTENPHVLQLKMGKHKALWAEFSFILISANLETQ